MPQMAIRSTLAVSSTTNVASGKLFEHVRGGGADITIYGAQTNEAYGDAEVTVFFGDAVIVQDMPLPLKTTGPVVPDDAIASGTALPGDQITINAKNNDAAATVDVTLIVDVTNL